MQYPNIDTEIKKAKERQLGEGRFSVCWTNEGNKKSRKKRRRKNQVFVGPRKSNKRGKVRKTGQARLNETNRSQENCRLGKPEEVLLLKIRNDHQKKE